MIDFNEYNKQKSLVDAVEHEMRTRVWNIIEWGQGRNDFPEELPNETSDLIFLSHVNEDIAEEVVFYQIPGNIDKIFVKVTFDHDDDDYSVFFIDHEVFTMDWDTLTKKLVEDFQKMLELAKDE